MACALGLAVLWWLYEASHVIVSPAEVLAGPVTRVRDGDTIEVAGRAVRLKGLACEELDTPRGRRAAAELRALAAGSRIECRLTGERSHDRAVGWCALADGRDLGETLIAQGLCGRCARYDPLRRYAEAQSRAGGYGGALPGYCFAPW